MSISPLALLSLAALGVATAFLIGQRAAEGDTPIPEVDLPDKLGQDAHVLLLGDSLAVGISPHLAKLFPNLTTRAKVGQTVQGALAALQGDEATFDAVVLSFGSNDALTDPAKFPGALQLLLAAVRGDKTQVFWAVPPGFTFNTTKSPAGADAFTQAITDAGIPSDHWILSPKPPAPDDPMHLHLSPSGYQAFAAAIAIALLGPEAIP